MPKYFSNPDSLSADTTIYAYKDTGGTATIGWGSITLPNGSPVHIDDTISKAEADDLFDSEIEQKENAIRDYANNSYTDNQYAALISLAYNAGEGRARDMIDFINSGASVQQVVDKWKGFIITSGGVVTQGLINRRLDESKLYDGSYNAVYSYYLRNEATIDKTALIVGISVAAIGTSVLLYTLLKKRA